MTEVFSAAVAFGASIVLTPLVMLGARRSGMIAQPTSDRWHRRPTALLGGIAIFAAFLAGTVPFIDLTNEVFRLRVLGILAGSTLMFGLGLLDDIVGIKPGTKLIGQILAACVLVYSGVYFNILDMPLVTIPLTIFFVVGITNAFNLLDNMDGLASGIATICVLTIFLFNQLLGKPQAIGILCLSLAGALAGFLIYNFKPAKIFMGDSGSMFIGFSLAAVSILGTWEQASNTFMILAVPVLLLGLPIFDTTFVTVTRRLSGRPVSQGGRDHTSHRLVQLGLSERKAVLTMYGVCAAFATIAVLSLHLGVFVAGILGILSLIVVFLFGVFLGKEKLYKPAGAEVHAEVPKHHRRGTLIGTLVLHKLRMVEVLIDLLLFGAAYVGAYLIRFDGVLTERHQELIIYSLPIVLAVKFLTFYGFGMYRHLWEFTGIHDLIVIGKAVVTGSLLTIFVLWGLTRLGGYSRTVFIMDGILLLLFAAGSRVLLRVFRESISGASAGGRRLLIYGAGTAGETLLRELRSDPGLGYVPIGFMDDDYRKQGKRMHGLKIHGGRERLQEIVGGAGVDEIVIAIPSLGPGERKELSRACLETGATCRSMRRITSAFLPEVGA